MVKRAWGEALTPVGILAAGRMGAHFGLGITANGGDCEDCDRGDAADRVAFVAPLAGHLLAVAWDIAVARPVHAARGTAAAPIALEPTDTRLGPRRSPLLKVALAGRARPPRRCRAHQRSSTPRTSPRRAQDNDVPASYLPIATPPTDVHQRRSRRARVLGD